MTMIDWNEHEEVEREDLIREIFQLRRELDEAKNWNDEKGRENIQLRTRIAKLQAELSRLEYLHRVALGLDELTDEMDNLSPEDDIESLSDVALYEKWKKEQK